jgi:type I restriction enzyme S subunit
VKGYIRGPFGSALRKADMVSEGIPVYEQQHAIYNHRDFRYYVTEEKAKKLSRFKTMPGDIILSCSGTIGMCSVITDDDAIGIINQALLILRPNKTVLTMYLYWFLKSSYGHSSVLSRTAGSAQPNLSSRKEIEAIPFPLPTISVQEAFVSQLSHVNSYLGLLYAEREARRKQFAYYRDKLLAFPEKVAS